MKNRLFKSFLPVGSIGNTETKVLLSIGEIDVEIGEVIDVLDVPTRNRYRDEYVLDVRSTRIEDIEDEILDAWGYSRFTELREALTERLQVTIPSTTMVTVVITGSPETDLTAGTYEEPLEDVTSDDDIPDLVFPTEDLEDVDPSLEYRWDIDGQGHENN